MFKIPFEANLSQFTEALNVDGKLQLSCENLVDEVRRNIKVDKLTKDEKLQAIREFPTTAVLATFSWKVYDNLEKATLPDGWQLLTTANNKEIHNGYYGAAFWNPTLHHMIVVHRGTELNNVGAVVADIAGIVFNNCGGQMESACTFSAQVVQAMRTIESENEKVHFEVFFTGHSLGAWLAQITSFSTAFLKSDGETFIRLDHNDNEPFHAQATVFDSPGCLPMLQKLKKRFETEDREPIDLRSLSIASYLSAPNQINTCNEHFGKVYRIFIDTSKMNFMDRSVAYTLTMHSIENIVNFFQANSEIQILEVLDWPIREGITGTHELEKFLKLADHRNRYHIQQKIRHEASKVEVRYKTRVVDRTIFPLSVFTKREQIFLEHFRWFRQLPEFASFKAIFVDIKSSNEVVAVLESFDIVEQNFHIRSHERLKEFVPRVKLLLKLFPMIAEKARKFLIEHKIRSKVFALETKHCLENIKRNLLEVKPSAIDMSKFLEKRFLSLKLKAGKARTGLSMIYKAFKNSELAGNYSDGSVLAMDLRRFSSISEVIDIKDFLSTTNESFLLILYCESFWDSSQEFVGKFIDAVKDCENLKVVMIGEAEDEAFNEIARKAQEKLGESFHEFEKSFSWGELTCESQLKVLNQEIKFQGRPEKLANLMTSNESFQLPDKVLLQLLNDEALEVNADQLSTFDFSVFTTEHDKKEIKSKIFLESLEFGDDIFVVSGLYDDSFEVVSRSLAEVLKVDDPKQLKIINDNLVIGDEKLGGTAGKLHAISIVGSDKCLEDFDEKCRNFHVENSRKLIHWIKIVDGKLTWRKSYNFESYVARKLKMNSRLIDDTKLSNESDKLVAMFGQSGEGRSTFLTNFANEKSRDFWVILLDFEKLAINEKLNHESLASSIESSLGYDPENHLQSFLLRHKISTATAKPIHFCFDGFEKIHSDKDRQKALKLLKFIRDETKCSATFTSTEAFKNALNDLQPSVCIFEKLVRSERENLLKQFWISRFVLVWGHKKCAEIFDDEKKSKFLSFAKILLDQLDSTIEGKAGLLMGIPQQLRLLADGFQEDFDKFIQLNTMKQKILEGLKLKTFYQHYINTKYDLYVTAKTQAASLDKRSKSLLKTFQNVSIDSLLPKDLLNKSELFSADYVILQLTKGQSPPKVLATLTGYLLTDSRCASVRAYLNKHEEFLPKTAAFDINDETSKAILGQPMITACRENLEVIVKFLIELLRKNSGLKNVELGCDEHKKDALSYAIENRDEKSVQLLVDFLTQFGDKKVFTISLLQDLTELAENSENREFTEWCREFLHNNNVD